MVISGLGDLLHRVYRLSPFSDLAIEISGSTHIIDN